MTIAINISAATGSVYQITQGEEILSNGGSYGVGQVYDNYDSFSAIGDYSDGSIYSISSGYDGYSGVFDLANISDTDDNITVNVSVPGEAVDIEVAIVLEIDSTIDYTDKDIQFLDSITSRNIQSAAFNKAFDITLVATGNDVGYTGEITINSYVEVTIDISPPFSSTANIRIFYYDTLTQTWLDDGITLVTVELDRVVFQTTHLTYFAVAEVSLTDDPYPPAIQSYLVDGQSIVTGDYVSAQPTVSITATDNKGITDYRIFVLDKNNIPVAGNDTGTVNITSVTNITLAQKIPSELSDGTYSITAIVQDVSGNSILMNSPQFNVVGAGELVFTDVLSAPNPFDPSSGDGYAHIGYQLNKQATVKLYIHSYDGELIYSDKQDSSLGYSEFRWDGQDRWGNAIRNGGYLAYLLADDGRSTVKKLVKIAILK